MRLKAYTVMQPVNKIHLRYCKADSKNKNPKGIVLYYKGKHLKRIKITRSSKRRSQICDRKRKRKISGNEKIYLKPNKNNY